MEKSEKRAREKARNRIVAAGRVLSFAAVFAIFLLLPIASADGITNLENKWQYGGWLGLGMLAVMISTTFDALIYMIGYGLQLENLKRWAVSELLQTFASGLMIILFITLLSGAFDFVSDNFITKGSTVQCGSEILGGQGQILSPPDVFLCKTQNLILTLDSTYDQIYNKNKNDEFATSVSYNIAGVPVYFGEWTYRTVVEQNHLLGDQITQLLVSLHAQYVLMGYIAENMLNVFLPLGLLLRVFPITRGVGGMLIATAIGFYFVFPTLYIINDPTFVKAPPAAEQGTGTTTAACFQTFSGVTSAVAEIQLGGGIGGAASSLSISDIANTVAQLRIEVMFFPFIAFAITIIFIRSAAPILGGEAGDLIRMASKVA